MSTEITSPPNGAPQVSPVNELRRLLEKSKGQIAMALPRHLTPERMIRVALTAFLKTPGLQECSAMSIVACVVQVSELGLELSGPLGHAWMIPYYNKQTKQKEAQFQVGYKGLMELAYRSGKVLTIQPRAVYQGDRFRYTYGTSPEIIHEPCDKPGQVAYVYAVLSMISGGVDFEVMSAAQVEAHRQQYSKQANGFGWTGSWEAMAKKTVIARLCRRAPLSVEMQRAIAADEAVDTGFAELELPAGPPTERISLRRPAEPRGPEFPDPSRQIGDEPEEDPTVAEGAGRD